MKIIQTTLSTGDKVTSPGTNLTGEIGTIKDGKIKILWYIVVALGAVAVFGARNCQHTTKANARHNVQFITEPAIEPNACYMPPFLCLKIFLILFVNSKS